MSFVGYQDVRTMPVKRGDVVTIRKGVMVHSTRTGETKPAGRTYSVKVDHILCGYDAHMGYEAKNPTVVWAGSGKYWHSADINDVL